jgi:transcriptional regulator
MARVDHLKGALELLILKVLRRQPSHGYAIAMLIEQTSDAVLKVEEGSLYPALHRMTEAGLLRARWSQTEAGRRARFYELTPRGRTRLAESEAHWHDVTTAVARVLRSMS